MVNIVENFNEAVEIITKIEKLGYTAVIVGGAVRDRLLGLDSYDIDIATAMPIDSIKKHFDVLDNGSSYLSVTINMNGNLYEITAFREDLKYDDHRHPVVSYVDSFLLDSKRRDFTINALAYDYKGNLLDYHNGANDLNNRLIRAIGEPTKRFNEDALRILRALYLASKLNFTIEENTLAGIISTKHLLKSLSDERILPMLHRIINAKYDKGIEYINRYSLFEYIPVYERLLTIAKRGLAIDELLYAYYLGFDELPINMGLDKAIIRGIKGLKENSFNTYSLYIYKDVYIKIRHMLNLLGYATNSYDNIIDSFVIKNDSELALKKEEIASYFDGKEKSIKIKMVIEAILNKKIPNTRGEILRFIGRGL